MSTYSSQICEHCLASCDDCLSICFFVYVCSFFCQAFSNLLSIGLCDMCVVSSVARHTTRLLLSVFLSICVPHRCTIAKDGILQLWPHWCTTFCQRWDSLVVDPQLLHYCQRWDFGGCDPHCRIIAKNGILWVVSMDALRLAKMGFSGCVPRCSTIAKDGILHFCPHWGTIAKDDGILWLCSHCGMIAKDGIFWLCSQLQHSCQRWANSLVMTTLPALLPQEGILWFWPHCSTLLAKEGILTPAISYPPENRNKLCLIFNITIQSDFFDCSHQSECGDG